MKRSTKSIVLAGIWANPGAHRKEIASRFGLHPALVSSAVRSLIKERWVVEGGRKKTALGRAPISLSLDTENRAVSAVSYSADSMTCGLVNADGDVLRSKTVRHSLRDPEDIVELAARNMAVLRRQYRGIVMGIAVADPGMVDHAGGTVIRSSSFPHWRDVALAGMLGARTGLRAVVADSSQARAIAQYRILLARGEQVDPMLYIHYTADNVGFTLVDAGRVWRGAGFAGEVGHVAVDLKGALCRCGARGCLESLAGATALENRASSFLAKGAHSVYGENGKPGAAEIFRAARAGDRFARTMVRETLVELCFCVSIVVAMLHPALVVAGAESDGAGELLCKEMRRAIDDRVMHEIASSVKVVRGDPAPRLSLTGAGLMLFDNIIRAEGGKRVSVHGS